MRGHYFAIIPLLFCAAAARADYSLTGHVSDFESRVSLNATGPSGE